MHRLLRWFASTAFLYFAETAHVDVALVDAEDQVVETLDGPTCIASVLLVAAVAAATAAIAPVLLVGAIPGGVSGLVALEA